MKQMNPRESRIVAVGILVAVLAAAWLAVVNPVIHGFAARERERDQLIETYRRNQRLLAGIRTWSADAQALRRTDAGYAVPAPSPALAGELLRERVGRVITSGGGAVKSVQDQPADAQPGWVRVRADATVSTNQLIEALRRLQLEEPHVVVEYLSVGADRAAQAGRAAPMDVRLEVSARFRPAKAP
jgi:type II secretory pathway component PulM